MRKALRTPLALLCAMPALQACVGGTVSVVPQGAGCSALIPPTWAQGVEAPEFTGKGDVVGDWITYADAVVGRLDVANDRQKSTIHLLTACEKRDAAAVKQARKGWLARLFS